ncbi:hypothetical protein P43SY_001766 [Pythium insidiosum]|uniref:YjeF N-terminal domain-containing protein n=1 Tax=Pythium insidiosum TaxID=114742 RepID=A0AAD5QBP7_PYTIN|nr:hypothetical protein P43SY_001766 [Pythium insidiosum]
MNKLKAMTRREAQRFDERLMSSEFGFSIDQLMELAGLSVACAIEKEYPAVGGSDGSTKRKVLVVAGPGNNGLVTQCKMLDIPFVDTPKDQ